MAVSFCSMAYELVLAKTLVFLTDEIILWESLSIGLFIAAIGCGIFLAPRVKTEFWAVERALTLSGLLAVPFLLLLHMYYRIYLADYQTHRLGISSLDWVMVACQGPNVLIGLLSGLELTLLFKFAEEGDEARVIAFYNFGALLASVMFALVPLTGLENSQLALLASLINAGIALHFGRVATDQRYLAAFVSLYLVCLPLGKVVEQIHRKNYYFNPITLSLRRGAIFQTGPLPISRLADIWRMPSIERINSPYQAIDLVPENEGHEFRLFLDGHFQFTTLRERYYHEIMAHVPIMLTRSDIKFGSSPVSSPPLKALILGGGDGMLARELLKYGDAIPSIDLVELDPHMIELGKSLRFAHRNDSSLSHPNVTVITEDAFTWLRQQKKVYDAVYVDFPYPFTFEGLRIYSVEFFKLVSRRIRRHGFLVLDTPLEDGSQTLLHATLALAGFSKFLGMRHDGETFLLASQDDKPFHLKFRRLGIPLSALDAEWFRTPGSLFDLGNNLPSEEAPVNSALKPRKLALGDGWK